MNLLKAALYDPAGAVSKATSALLALTALDTTNLRLAITVPAHGMVRFRARVAIVGATTPPVILLGVLNGAAIVGRVAPLYTPVTAPLATHTFLADMEFTATGLTPGAMNVDLAYAVQVVVAATNIKYGGPNTNAGANAWGAAVFEAWDPQPLTAALDGAVNVKQWNGTAVAAPATAGIPEVNVKNVNNVSAAAVTTVNANQGTTQPLNFTGAGASALAKSDMVDIAGAAVATGTAQIGVNVVNYGGSAGTFAAGRPEVNATHWRGTALAAPATAGIPKVAIEAAGDFAQAAADKAWATATRVLTAGTNLPTAAEITDAVWDELLAGHAGIGSAGLALTTSAASGLDAAGVRAALGMAAPNLDVQLTALDADVLTRLASISYTAPDNAGIGAIKGKTDSLNFTLAGKLDTHVLAVNGVIVIGTGAPGDRWRAFGT